MYEHPKLRTVTFSAMIADKASGGCAPGEVEIILDNLATIARNGVPCRFLYGITALPYAVALTKFSFTVERRNMSGVPTQVSVDLQLTEKLLIQQIVTELAAIVETPATPGSVIAAPPPEDELPDVNPSWTRMLRLDLVWKAMSILRLKLIVTLVDGLFTGEHGLIDLLRVGEIGDGLIPIIESVTEFDYDLTAKMVSQITFSVYDPGFNMLNNNFFLIGEGLSSEFIQAT